MLFDRTAIGFFTPKIGETDMLFSSITFLYYFLPIVMLVYFAVPKKFKNLVLFLSSIVFYFFGEPIYSLLMVFSSLLGWLFGLWINKTRGTKFAKVPMTLSIVTSLGCLGFFKYSNFFIDNVNKIFGGNIGLLELALPIGISFYTFQILSYTIDVYRGTAEVQRSFLDFATYVCLFPQLIAGPIVRYSDIADQLQNRIHSTEKFAYGVRRFVVGLSKKVLLANALGEIGVTFAALTQNSVLFYWLFAISFTLHIYFDFSGYSDMAIGLGKMFGFDFIENFNYPYISGSITEFWRRWHISLGSWFRDYLYIPLGGNRVKQWRWVLNILIVWFLTGFWHGAEWNFVVWGLYFAVFLLLEKFFLKKFLDKAPVIRNLYTLFVVIIGFTIFNANNMGEAITNLTGMFGGLDIPLVNNEALYTLRSYWLILLMGIIGATPLVANTAKRIKATAVGEKVLSVAEPIVLICLMIMVTAYLVDGSFNPFLYFRF